MSCPCGGPLRKSAESSKPFRLEWRECNSCGRCGFWELRVDGELVSTGAAAWQRFRDAVREAEAAPQRPHVAGRQGELLRESTVTHGEGVA